MGSFLGRSDRWEYWTSIALLTVAGGVLPMLHVRAAVLALFVMWPVTWARRLHDIDMSAWVALVPSGLLVALIGGGMFFGGHEFTHALRASMQRNAQPTPEFDLMLAIVLVSLVVQYGFTIWLGIKAGDPDDNRFGPPHRARIAKAEK
jgi:uncharacterized membrane protein YhaH (DUF805 family)